MEQNSQGNGNIAPLPKKRLKSLPIARKKPKLSPKDEIIAIERSKGATKTDAYMKAYPDCSYDSARTLAPQRIEARGIDQRALQLLASQGLDEAKLARSLNECVDDEDKRIKLDATKFGLGMIGYGKEQKEANQSYNPTQINIIIRPANTQANDTIEVKDISNDA